jgi:hypothetical protein
MKPASATAGQAAIHADLLIRILVRWPDTFH